LNHADEANDRTLLINEIEAESIRTIYALYLEIKSVDGLKSELDRRGFRTRLRPGKSASMIGGHAFSRGHLYRILSNPLYAGEIGHKGQRYPGQHPAIIDRETWDAVQEQLARNGHERLVKAHAKEPTLLSGLLYDSSGERLVVTHAVKQGKRYRYYVSARTLEQRRRSDAQVAPCDSPGTGAASRNWRLPAAEIEPLVMTRLGKLFALMLSPRLDPPAPTAMLASRANASPFCERTADFSYALVPAPSGASRKQNG
jgi:hypothetical protein